MRNIGISFGLLVGFALLSCGTSHASGPTAETNPFVPTIDQVQARFGAIEQEVARLQSAGLNDQADAMSAQLQHFRDELAGTAGSAIAGPQLDWVGVFEGYGSGTAAVEVTPTDRPVVLALSSWDPVAWNLQLQSGANLEKVIVYSRGTLSTVSGVPGGVPIEYFSGYESDMFAYEKNYYEYPGSYLNLRQVTGLGASTFQGAYTAPQTAFTIGQASGEWAAQRVLTEMLPLYQQATAYRKAQERDAAAPYRFTALLDAAAPYEAHTIASTDRVAQCSPLGTVSDLSVLPISLGHLAIDPSGSTYYGISYGIPVGEVWQIDRATSAVTVLPVTGTGVPTPSFPNGLVYDTARNRLVLSDRYSLYAYSLADQEWSVIASLDRGVESLAYWPINDSYYTLEDPEAWDYSTDPGPRYLLRYDPTGELVDRIPISEMIPATTATLPGEGYQLIATGDRLALLTPPTLDLCFPDEGLQRRCFLIDPLSGDVTYSGIVTVPEPSAALLLVGAAFLVTRRTKRS